jgi:hypothetical protein
LIRVELILLGILVAGEAEARTARAALDVCPEGPIAIASLLKVLPLELGDDPRLVQTSTAPDLLLTISVVDCGPNAKNVAIAALDRRSGVGVDKNVGIDRDRGAARVVAIAMAELIGELALKSTPPARSATATIAAPRIVVPPAPEPDPPPPAPIHELRLHLGVDAYPGIGAAQTTLALGSDLLLQDNLRIGGGLALGYGLERDVRGRIDLALVAAFVEAKARLDRKLLILELGPRVIAGWAFAAGRPGSGSLEGQRVDAFLATLWLDLGIGWSLGERFAIGGRISAGYVLSGLIAQADGNDLTGLEGAAIGVALYGAYQF